MIDYAKAYATYDNTRSCDEGIIGLMARRGVFEPRLEAGFPRRARVLDFGCGTGNYLERMTRSFGCDLYGLEPSDGMRRVAIAKNPALTVAKGDHSSMPFEDGFFDFIYMTDVVHHVPDLDLLFEMLHAKLAPEGLACIVSESHEQIEARWYNAYFPSLAGNEKSRYPDIPELERRAGMAGFVRAEAEVRRRPSPRILDEAFLRMVAERNYSMFRLLGEAEYEAGSAAMKRDLGRSFGSSGAGDTLLWLEKGGA